MTTKRLTRKTEVVKSTTLSLDNALLVFCLGIICLRVIHTESPPVQSSSLPGNIGDNLYSVIVSGCLLAAFFIRLIRDVLRGEIKYRWSKLEIGFGLFCLAAVLSGFAAADKRLAITNIVVLTSPLLCAVLLVQLLDSQAKIKFVLAVVAALGVLCAYQGFEQFFTTNQATIEQYQQNPEFVLEQFGIEPNSLEQFLFEHRLNSKNVSSFFTTRNSAGSFLLIAFFAASALVFVKLRNPGSTGSTASQLLGIIIPIAIILFGLLLTRSKGAIISFVLAVVSLYLLCRFGNRLKNHRKLILSLGTLLVTTVIVFIILYGSKYDMLPGGNSMLVRWQYWKGTSKLIEEHPLFGVGPGNFAYFYQRYKPAAALESITDPHNFPLSLLAQYGILGLAGFLLMIFNPLLFMTHNPGRKTQDTELKQQGKGHSDRDKHLEAYSKFLRVSRVILIIWVCLLLGRQLLAIPAGIVGADRLDVLLYLFIRFFLPPAIVFAVSLFLLLRTAMQVTSADAQKKESAFITAALTCGIAALLLHNMTDFALFEPGVYTTFWMILACVIAVNANSDSQNQVVFRPNKSFRIIVAALALLILTAFVTFALVPQSRSVSSINKARQAMSQGQYDKAHDYLDDAVSQDVLSDLAASIQAQLYLRQYELQQIPNPELLILARQTQQIAINRNKADYKNFEKLAEILYLHYEVAGEQEKSALLNEARAAASQAVVLYPGSGKLHYKLAQIADSLGDTKTALEHYSQAVEIEQQYQLQFRKMYPEIEQVVSRLGQEKYNLATERIKELQNSE